MRLIIDADSMIWVAAYYTQVQSLEESLLAMDKQIEEIRELVKATDCIAFIGNKFLLDRRALIYPEYKKNRGEKPTWFAKHETAIRLHLIDNGAQMSSVGLEADDMVAIEAAKCRREKEDYVICGVDKDLNQIEGNHYNPQKKEMYYVSEEQARRSLCKQILTGDTTDNIKGLPGIGPVKAEKILESEMVSPESAMICEVLSAYIKQLGYNKGIEEFCKNTLLVLLTENDSNTTIGGDTPEITSEIRETS